MAKLNRRLHKFELSGHADCLRAYWLHGIQLGITDAHALIDKHWQPLIKETKTNIDTTMVQVLRPANDLSTKLPDVDAFLADIVARRQEPPSSSFQTGSPYPDFAAAELPVFAVASGEYKHFSLAAFEKWVEQHLQSWAALHIHEDETCGGLRRLMESYHSSAGTTYAGKPFHMSIMYLTLIELWMTMDTSACAIFPMLREYDPEVCLDELQCLILPLKSQMKRLDVVERYVTSRRDAATSKQHPSVYRQFGHDLSFAVRHFQQSVSLQATLSSIERDAAAKSQQKRQELARLKLRYQEYMDKYNRSSCEYEEVVTNRYHGYTRSQHSRSCSRCASKQRADSLGIKIFEWPVSSEPSVAKATVFELKVPQPYSDWRDGSRYMITKVLGYCNGLAQKPHYSFTLNRHENLSQMLSSRYSDRRVVLSSSIKPHNVTHRKQQKVTPHLHDDDVCLKNALRYEYFDRYQETTIVAVPRSTGEAAKHCMYRLPSRSKNLERFMNRPSATPDGITPNEVVASLCDCPDHFSIDEYKALASLPFGRHTIYSNTLTQLASSAIDLTKVEAQCFMLQAIQQVGPPNNSSERVSHHILVEATFGDSMLDQLEESLQRLAENWESWRAGATFSLLARRILSLTSSKTTAIRCRQYLEKLRRVHMVWINRLKQRARASTDDDQRNELYSRATEIALSCTSTYDVEDLELDEVLSQHAAISTLFQCSITVQENYGSVKSEHQSLYNAMLHSWRSMMYRLFPKIHQVVLQDSTGLCEAVTNNWAAFQPAARASWISLVKPQQHWLHILSGTLDVRFNLLTAELLVNGLPLSRLPREYMIHPMYASLFQNSTLEVVPTDEAGMRFSAKATYHDYKLHFGMKNRNMLVVAIKDGSR